MSDRIHLDSIQSGNIIRTNLTNAASINEK